MLVLFAVWYTCLCSNVFHVVICHVAEYASSFIRRPKIRLFLVHRKTGKPLLACMGNPATSQLPPTSNKHTFSGEWGLFLQTRVKDSNGPLIVNLGREVLFKSSDSCQSERTSSRSVARVMAISFRMLEGLKINSLQCEL